MSGRFDHRELCEPPKAETRGDKAVRLAHQALSGAVAAVLILGTLGIARSWDDESDAREYAAALRREAEISEAVAGAYRAGLTAAAAQCAPGPDVALARAAGARP